MCPKRLVLWTIVFLVAVPSPSAIFAQAKYIRITANGVNIRAGVGTSSPIVAKGWRGDVFELHGREGKWYKIRMFSVDWRYVHRSLAEATPYVVSVPNQVSTRRDIFRALVRAEGRAEEEADRKYPVEDRSGRPIPWNVKKNIEYMWVLSDRYQLKVMHRFKVQPPIHGIVIHEGVKKNW